MDAYVVCEDVIMRPEPGIGDLSKAQYDAHRQGIAHMWKMMDHLHHTEVSRIRKKYHIQSFEGYEGIDIDLFFRGRYVWAQLEWSGDISDCAYVESLDEYDSEFKWRLYDIAQECGQIIIEIMINMTEFCNNMGWEMEWDENSVVYRGHGISLESRPFQTDWGSIDVLD
jgi:hypothetical protein